MSRKIQGIKGYKSLPEVLVVKLRLFTGKRKTSCLTTIPFIVVPLVETPYIVKKEGNIIKGPSLGALYLRDPFRLY